MRWSTRGKVIVKVFLFTFLLILAGNPAFTQQTEYTEELRSGWGFDILVSDGGIGAGGFYRREFTPTIAGFINLSISESKDPREVEMVDWFTGQQIVPGKINRFLVIPMHIGVQYRLFKDQIMDNFRPFLSAGLGPSMIYSTPYEHSFFKALGYGKAYHTVGGFIGAGAYIGSDPSNLVGINFRYYYVPYFSGIISMIDFERSTSMEDLHYRQMKQFGGFYITFTFGMAR
jgi:hypothetical protein